MAFRTIKHALAANVATSGTFTVGYPTGTNAGSFSGHNGQNKLVANGGTYKQSSGHFSLTFGASNITVTWLAAVTLRAGSEVVLELDVVGSPLNPFLLPSFLAPGVAALYPLMVNFGAVLAGDDDGVCASQTAAGAGDFSLNGALVAGGVATFDVPRNVELVSATTDHSARTFTIYGEDEYGAKVVENMAGPNAATIVVGKKAFKKVTRVAVDGAISTNGVKVGMGWRLGLPLFLANRGFITRALVDGVDELSSATINAGSAAVPTATTGDVRGTVTFNTAANGSKVLTVIGLFDDLYNRGLPQYSV